MRDGSDCGGFTIMEILVAIFIIVIALTGVIAVTCTVINGNAFSKELTTATALAQDTIEDLKNQPYAALADGDPETVNTSYTRSWKVRTDLPGTGMKTVEVNVAWRRYGQRHDITLSTIIAQ